jgi:phage tail sheath gpL-like
MGIGTNSRAPGSQADFQSVPDASLQQIPSKIIVFGKLDPSKTSFPVNTPVRMFTEGQAGLETGRGHSIAYLVRRVFAQLGGRNIPVWVSAQEEDPGDVAATGTIAFAVGTASVAFRFTMRIGHFDKVSFTVPAGTDQDGLATLLHDSINADSDLPVSASVLAETVTVTSKTKGEWGNGITLRVDEFSEEIVPTTTDPTGGLWSSPETGLDAGLLGLGQGDLQNKKHFTELVHAYGGVTACLDSLQAYNGDPARGEPGSVVEGTGNFQGNVNRPYRTLWGDTTSSLAELVAVTDTRLSDAANGVIAASGIDAHPAAVAAQALTAFAVVSDDHPANEIIDAPLVGVDPSANPEWYDNYNDRDTATLSGIGVLKARGDSVILQALVTHYRPVEVAEKENTWREMRNHRLVATLHKSHFDTYSLRLSGKIITDSVLGVRPDLRDKAIDKAGITGILSAMIVEWQEELLIQSAAEAIETLSVQIRENNTGYDMEVVVRLVGVLGILKSTVGVQSFAGGEAA